MSMTRFSPLLQYTASTSSDISRSTTVEFIAAYILVFVSSHEQSRNNSPVPRVTISHIIKQLKFQCGLNISYTVTFVY